MGKFHQVFKQLRLDRGLTQDQISQALGITKQAVSHYERGTREPKQEMLEAIADYFNVDINYLLGHAPMTSQILSDDEYTLITAYRLASPEIRSAAQAVLRIRREEECES